MNDVAPTHDSPATKADLELALKNFELSVTIRLGCIIVAGSLALLVLQWIESTCLGMR